MRLRPVASFPAVVISALALCACGARDASSSNASARSSSTSAYTQPVTVTPAPGGPGPQAAVAATDRLALSLLGELGAGGNVVLSPYSIQTALAMIDQGAGGETAAQIAHVLGEPDAAKLAAANRALIVALALRAGSQSRAATSLAPTLLDASSLWLQSGLSLKPAFSASLATNFGAAPQLVDFRSAPDAARLQINAWVARRTEQLIRDLMPPSTITSQTVLVLANAIYLKARWQFPFDRSATVPMSFFPPSGPPVHAPFMTQHSISLRYAHGAGYQAIELPYRDSTLAMLAIMPAPGTIAQFERRLSATALAQIAGSLSSRFMDVAVPRLALSVHSELNAVLSALGMPLAFQDGADFSGISSQLGLKIEAVEHAATLKLDEAGTVAAAATGISVQPTAVSPIGELSVTLDHPFLLFLRDRSTGAILFAGRVTDPLAG